MYYAQVTSNDDNQTITMKEVQRIKLRSPPRILLRATSKVLLNQNKQHQSKIIALFTTITITT